MADNSARIATMTRLLAVAHIIIGFLLVCFGIADRVVGNYTGYGYYGVWVGIWMCIAGGLGIPGSGIERTGSRNAFAGIFMGFSITSAVFGGIIILAYSIALSWYPSYQYRHNNYMYYDGYHSQLAMLAIMLILGIAAFVVGIWAPVCCCLLKPCCTTQQGQQAMYAPNQTAGYVMTQSPGGVPVAAPFPAQVVQPAMASGYPPQVQPQFVQISPSNAIPAKGNPPQQSEMPATHGHGGYMALNEQA